MLKNSYGFRVAESVSERVLALSKGSAWLEPYGDGSATAPHFDLGIAAGLTEQCFVTAPSGEICGVASVSYCNPTLAQAERTGTGLPLGRLFDDSALVELSVAQVGHVVVAPEHRNTPAAGTLIDGVLDRLERRGIRAALGTASLATNDPQEAMVVSMVAGARSLVHPTLWLPARPLSGAPQVTPIAAAPMRLYGAEERAKALRGRLDEVRMAGPLRLYTRSFGAVVCGEPVPYGSRGIFVVPVIAPTRPSAAIPGKEPRGGGTLPTAA